MNIRKNKHVILTIFFNINVCNKYHRFLKNVISYSKSTCCYIYLCKSTLTTDKIVSYKISTDLWLLTDKLNIAINYCKHFIETSIFFSSNSIKICAKYNVSAINELHYWTSFDFTLSIRVNKYLWHYITK